MVNDRRNYTRLSIVDVPVLLYIDDKDFEINGYVHDISELGIGITIDSDIDISQVPIKLNNEVKIVFCDKVYYSTNSSEKFIITTKCVVRHIETKNNYILFGGQIIDEDFRNYYLKKEMMHWRMTNDTN